MPWLSKWVIPSRKLPLQWVTDLVRCQGTDGKPKQDTFVLKTYHEDYKKLYDNEITAFTNLQNIRSSSNNIIRYFGSFMQSNKYSLVLDFANGGSLLEFFVNNRPPETAEDRLSFWKSYSGYFRGAYRIHQVQQSSDRDIRGYVHVLIREPSV